MKLSINYVGFVCPLCTPNISLQYIFAKKEDRWPIFKETIRRVHCTWHSVPTCNPLFYSFCDQVEQVYILHRYITKYSTYRVISNSQYIYLVSDKAILLELWIIKLHKNFTVTLGKANFFGVCNSKTLKKHQILF